MKTVIFTIFTNRAESIRRFLLLADPLMSRGIKLCFLDYTNSLSGVIKEHADQLGVLNRPEYIRYDDYHLLDLTGQDSCHCKGKESDCSCSSSMRKSAPVNNSLGKLLDLLNIDTGALINSHMDGLFVPFKRDVEIADKIIKEINPAAVVYDTELPQRTRAFIFAARKKNITVISMQHGEGNAEQYDKIPLLADFYIAYSPYNIDKLTGMGVKEKDIFLTGVPDTDLIFNYDIGVIKRELGGQHKIDLDKKLLLIALKPGNSEAYRNMNKEMLDVCRQNLKGCSDIEIVVKQHPTDLQDLASDYIRQLASMYSEAKFIRGEFAISKLFTVSDYFITYYSNSIVESVMQNTVTFVIDHNDYARWPDWNKYNLYDVVNMKELGNVLSEIREGAYTQNNKQLTGQRDEFIHYFRYRFDNNSAKRIADVINEVTGDVTEIEDAARVLNEEGEDLFGKGDLDGALNSFQEAIKKDPAFAVPYSNIGVIYWETGDVSNALDHFTKALKVDPEERDTVLNYGRVMTGLKRHDEARQVYSSYLQGNPGDSEVALALSNTDSMCGCGVKCESEQSGGGHFQAGTADPEIMPDIIKVSEDEMLINTKRVSIELSNLCNYSNIHKKCPLSHIREPVILPAKIVRDVIDTLAGQDFKGTIAFHTYNEPMNDPRLFSFIEYARKACPESHIYICTNGYYFSEVLAEEMVEAGVSEVHISAYSQSEYKRLSSIKMRVPCTVEFMKLDERLNLYDREESDISGPCFAPLNEVIISREGSVSLCCLDWKRECTFGDLHEQSFKDVLKSGELHAVYERLSRGERFLHICKKCGWVR